jgi:hypothetical protein
VRARKCPYALLLRQHCPLPPSLSWLSQQQGSRQRRGAAGAASAEAAAAPPPGVAEPAHDPAPPNAAEGATANPPSRRVRRRQSKPLPLMTQPQPASWPFGPAASPPSSSAGGAAATPTLPSLPASGGSGSSGDAAAAWADVTPLIQCAQPQRTPMWTAEGIVGRRAAARAGGARGSGLRDGSSEPRSMEVDDLREQQQPCGPEAGAAGGAAATAPPAAGPQPGRPAAAAAAGSDADEGATPGGDGEDADPLGLSACVVPPRAVSNYIWAVVRRVVPPALLGGRRSRAALRRGVDRFVRLRRHETVTLHHLLRGVRTGDMPWLAGGGGGGESGGGGGSAGTTQLGTPLLPLAQGTTGAAAAAQTAPHPGNQLDRQRQRRRQQRERRAAAAAGAAATGGVAAAAAGAREGGGGGGGAASRQRAPRSLHEARRRWLAQWVWWLVTDVVVPLVRNSFYVTESEPYRQQVFYYRCGAGLGAPGRWFAHVHSPRHKTPPTRHLSTHAYAQTHLYTHNAPPHRKPVWAHLQRQALDELIAERFAPVAPSDARAILSSRPLGFCRLRLLPKRTGMRPIANLKKPSLVRFAAGGGGGQQGGAAAAGGGAGGADAGPSNWHQQQQQRGRGRGAPGFWGAGPVAAGAAHGGGGGAGKRQRGGRPAPVTLSFRAVNQVLQPAFQALKSEVVGHRAGAGTSVYGYDDALKALHPFLRRWRAARAANRQIRAFVVSADISRAFDTGVFLV